MPDADLKLKKDIYALLTGLGYECKAKYDDAKRKLIDQSTGQDLVESDGVYYHLPTQTVIYTEATTKGSGVTDYIREKHQKFSQYYREVEAQTNVPGNVINRILLIIADNKPGGDLSGLDQTTIKFVVLESAELKNYYLYLLKRLGPYLKYEFNAALGIKTNENPKVVQAITVNLAGHTVYVFELSVEDIIKTCYAFRKKDVMDEGYQRLLKDGKLKDLSTFLKSGNANLFPNSILINLHNKLEQPVEKGYGIVELKYPMQNGSFNIIDGQHRVYGYCKSGLDLSAHKLIVAAFKDIPDASDEIRFFLKINKTQTPIDPTLLSLLMAKVDFKKEEKEFWRSQNLKLALKLSESGLYQTAIYKGGVKDRRSRGKPTLTSMADALEGSQLLAYKKKTRTQEELCDGMLQKISDAGNLTNAITTINTSAVSVLDGVVQQDKATVKAFLVTNRGFYVICRLIRGYKLLEGEAIEQHKQLSLDLYSFCKELKFTPNLINRFKSYYGEAGMKKIAHLIELYIKRSANTNSRLNDFKRIKMV